jgi:hypothetical protein
MSIDSTIDSLVSNQAVVVAKDGVRKYKAHLKRRKAAHDLPGAAANYIQRNGALVGLLNKLHVNPHLNPGKYPSTFGKVLGGLETLQIEAAFAPRNVKQTKKGGKRKTCHNFGQIFKVGYWGNALVLPYYYLPGQLGVLQFMGRELRPELDMPVKFYKPNRAAYKVGGLAYNPDLLQQDLQTIYAIEDKIIYLRFQASHYARHSDKVLPLVTWYDDGKISTKDSWMTFDNCRKVFWCCSLTAGVLHQAVQTNGDIAWTKIVDTTEHGIRQFLQSRIQLNLLEDFGKQAKPWPIVLEMWAATKSDRQLEGLLREVSAKGTNLAHLLDKCSRPLRIRCETALAPAITHRQTAYKSVTILDEPEGWFIRRRNQDSALLTEARLIIDQALYNPHDNGTYYCGRVVYKDQDIPFCEKRELVEDNTMRWMQTEVIKSGLGIPAYDMTWRGSAVQIALQLNPAKIAQGLVSVGWNQSEQVFDFQNYQLDRHGDVLTQHKRVIWPQTPADVPQPLELTPIELEPVLANNAGNRLLWAFLGLHITNLISPMYGYAPKGCAVHIPDGGRILNTIAGVTGCLSFPLTQKSIADALENEERHNWTTVVGMADKPQKALLRQFVEAGDERKCLVKVNAVQANVLAMQGWTSWNIESNASLSLPALELLPKLVPSYLANLMKRQGRMQSNAHTPLDLVFEDLQKWLQTLHADAEVVCRARDTVTNTTLASTQTLMRGLLVEGHVQIVPEGFGDGAVRTAAGVFVPQELVLSYLDKRTGLDVSAEQISTALAESKVVRAAKHGWCIDEKWLARNVH